MQATSPKIFETLDVPTTKAKKSNKMFKGGANKTIQNQSFSNAINTEENTNTELNFP